MTKAFTTLLFLLTIINISNAQLHKFYQTNQTPRFLKPGTNDTLTNPFSGGLNTPQFSNIDWNNDGKQDLFIFDKESNKVRTYLFENGHFTYAPQYESAFPFYLMGWAMLRDHNFDGKPDLFTSSFSHNTVTAQPFVFSALSIQLYVNRTVNVNRPVFNQYNNAVYDTGVYIGDPWNQNLPSRPIVAVSGALPSIEDMDGDGDDDILTNIGDNTTNHFYENLKKNKSNIPFNNDTTVYIMRDQCWGFISYNNNNHTYQLGVNRSLNSACVYNSWAKREMKHADQSMLMIDLNGDGIKDVIMGDSEFKTLISLINGRLQNTIKADSVIHQDTLFLSSANRRKEFMEYPAAYNLDINGDNKKELVISTNRLNSSRSVNNIWIYDADRVNANLQFTLQAGNDFLYKDMIDLGLRTAPAFTDIDGDGDKDLVVATSGIFEQTANNHDKLYLYLNITDSINPVFKLADSNLANISGGSQGYFFAHPTFGDLNGDGLEDLLIGEGNGNIAYYQNTTSGNNYSFALVNRNAFNILAGTYASPQLVDLNKDGLLDIVAGNTAGTIRYYKNKGSRTNPDFSNVATLDSLGKIDTKEIFTAIGLDPQPEINGYSAPHVADLNNDGIWELVTGSSTGKVYVYTNVYPHKDSTAHLINKAFVDHGSASEAYNKRFGNRTTVASAYLDGDNKPDLILGNISGGLTFLGTNETSVGLSEHSKTDNNAVITYPNPASSFINVQINRNTGSDIAYYLFDMLGQKMLQGTIEKNSRNTRINIPGLKDGLYLIRYESKDWNATHKILIHN